MTIEVSLIHPDGEVGSASLPDGEEARLHQLQELVGGYIEAVSLLGDRCMVFNENGKDGLHQINHAATAIAHEANAIRPTDYIAGVAIILPRDALQ